MKIDILTLFPDMLTGPLSTSILGRAQAGGKLTITLHQLRDWATDQYGTVDDTPYGGGAGMVLKVDVIDRALTDLKNPTKMMRHKPYVVLVTPQGKRFVQTDAKRLSNKQHLIFVAGHYEGFDERVRALVDEELSLGDFIVTGGELPTAVITEAIARLLPGVLGHSDSARDESFESNATGQITLEYPQYTRPDSYLPQSISRKRPLTVPLILKSGHHKKITEWRQAQAEQRTRKRRPDLR